MMAHKKGKGMTGKKHSEETKRKMRSKKHSEETKRKISEKRKLRIGVMSSNWKGGRIIVDGYRYIHQPLHPNATEDGYVCEHRLVMESHLGRFLKRKEVVHHIDGNKLDNKIENLTLYNSVGEHYIKEHSRRAKDGKFTK